MARKKDSPIGVGMTAKQMKRKRPINADLLNKIEPITDNQKILFENDKEGKNIFAYGFGLPISKSGKMNISNRKPGFHSLSNLF